VHHAEPRAARAVLVEALEEALVTEFFRTLLGKVEPVENHAAALL
jgi:hypothetical protein